MKKGIDRDSGEIASLEVCRADPRADGRRHCITLLAPDCGTAPQAPSTVLISGCVARVLVNSDDHNMVR